MSKNVLYEIARKWAVEVDDEEDENYGDIVERTERVRLIGDGGALAYAINDGPEVSCQSADAESAIADLPELNEVRPNQITSITTSPDLIRLLPLSLNATGDWGDYDEYAWSDEMREHVVESSSSAAPHDVYRVLYVNDVRWRMWHTDMGCSMLPGSEDEPTLEATWAYSTIYEVAEMNSGNSRNTLGIVTASVVLEINAPDTDGIYPDEGSVSLRLQQWPGDTASAAKILADWVMSSPVSYFFWAGNGLDPDPKNFVQLFAESAASDVLAASHTSEELVEASGYELDYYLRGSDLNTYFDFDLGTHTDVINSAAEIIGRANPEYHAMIVAAQDSFSAEAKARDARLRDIRGDEDDEDDEDDHY